MFLKDQFLIPTNALFYPSLLQNSMYPKLIKNIPAASLVSALLRDNKSNLKRIRLDEPETVVTVGYNQMFDFQHPFTEFDCTVLATEDLISSLDCPTKCAFKFSVPLDRTWYGKQLSLCVGFNNPRKTVIMNDLYLHEKFYFRHDTVNISSFDIHVVNDQIKYWYVNTTKLPLLELFFPDFFIRELSNHNMLSEQIKILNIQDSWDYADVVFFDVETFAKHIEDHFADHSVSFPPFLTQINDNVLGPMSLNYSCDPRILADNNFPNLGCKFAIPISSELAMCGDVLFTPVLRCPDDYLPFPISALPSIKIALKVSKEDSWIARIEGAISDAFASIEDRIVQLFKNLFDQIINAILNSFDKIENFLIKVMKTVFEAIRKLLINNFTKDALASIIKFLLNLIKEVYCLLDATLFVTESVLITAVIQYRYRLPTATLIAAWIFFLVFFDIQRRWFHLASLLGLKCE